MSSDKPEPKEKTEKDPEADAESVEELGEEDLSSIAGGTRGGTVFNPTVPSVIKIPPPPSPLKK